MILMVLAILVNYLHSRIVKIDNSNENRQGNSYVLYVLCVYICMVVYAGGPIGFPSG